MLQARLAILYVVIWHQYEIRSELDAGACVNTPHYKGCFSLYVRKSIFSRDVDIASIQLHKLHLLLSGDLTCVMKRTPA